MKRKMTAIIGSTMCAMAGGTLLMFDITGGTLPASATIANTNGQYQMIAQISPNSIERCMSSMSGPTLIYGDTQEYQLMRKQIAATACQNALTPEASIAIHRCMSRMSGPTVIYGDTREYQLMRKQIAATACQNALTPEASIAIHRCMFRMSGPTVIYGDTREYQLRRKQIAATACKNAPFVQ